MTAHIFRGSKQEIAEKVAAMEGDVREAIVYVADPSEVLPAPSPVPGSPGETVEDMFKEMEPYMSQATDVDDSREAIYTRMPGE